MTDQWISSDSGSSSGAVAGEVAGVVGAIFIGSLVGYFCYRKKQRVANEEPVKEKTETTVDRYYVFRVPHR
jgi:hypothetical protein